MESGTKPKGAVDYKQKHLNKKIRTSVQEESRDYGESEDMQFIEGKNEEIDEVKDEDTDVDEDIRHLLTLDEKRYLVTALLCISALILELGLLVNINFRR